MYSYYNAGNLKSVQSPADGLTTFTYDAADRLTSKTFGNGNYDVYGYTACDQVSSIGYYNPGGNGQNFLSYSYDPAGNRTFCNQGWYNTTYGYDGANQLVSETGGGTYAPPTLGYTYDHNGNRLTQTSNGTQVQSFTYDGHDKLTHGTAGNETPGYDKNGNETSNNLSGAQLIYDDEDRLTSIAIPGGATDTFTYNGLGLRVGKTDSTGSYAYVCDGASPGSPVLSDGHAIYTPGLSENRGGVSSYAAFDVLGNLRFMDNASAAQTYYQDTTGFGSGQNMGIGGNEAGPFKFGGANGCQTDADTGLVLMGHRYYDTRIGRFVTQDPAGSGDNWYAYAGNNPVNHTDPLGLYVGDPEPVTDQTTIHNGFAGAFYGDQSGLADFFDQEDQSEQRGAAGYAASVAINKATITGNANFSTDVQGLLNQIAATDFGANLLAQFTWSQLPLKIMSDYGDPNSHFYPTANINGNIIYDTILFNPNLVIDVYTTDGLQNEPSDVILEHEIGHDIFYEQSGNEEQIKDPDPGVGNQNTLLGDDVESVYENPYRAELGLPLRVNHGGVLHKY